MKIIFKILSLIITYSVFSQENKEVMKPINNVFLAMQTNDSVLLKTAFVDSPTLYTAIENSDETAQLIQGDFQKFINAIGMKKDESWTEPIWNEKVEIDGVIASVWVDYAFYRGNQFSHCGIDAFHLVKKKDGWKIFHLVDTRHKENCEIPETIANQYR